MSYKLQKKLEEEQSLKTGHISLSQCLKKHAEEFASKAVQKGMRVAPGKDMEEYEGVGTKEVPPEELPTGNYKKVETAEEEKKQSL